MVASAKVAAARTQGRMRMQVCRWVGASVGSAVLGALCVAYLDHPLARLTLRLEPFRRLLSKAPLTAPVFSVLAAAVITLALFLGATRRPWAPWMRVATIAALASTLAGMLIKYALKPIFGRTPAGVYLRTGQDSFHWFDAGKYFNSFPSTHAGQAAAALTVVWIFYPRWRWACVAAQLGLGFLLVVGEFHFPGDIIAGVYVGVVVGAATTSIWEAASNRWRVRSDLRRSEAPHG